MADDERARLLQAAETDLEAVEEALARLDADTYFSCEVCGEDIGEDRLAADPLTRRCAAHALPGPDAEGLAGEASAGESPENLQPKDPGGHTTPDPPG